MKRKQVFYFLIAATIFVSCGNDQSTAKSTSADTATEKKAETTAASTTANSGEKKADFKVTITGGDMAGTYEAVCNEDCCSYGIAGDKVFGNQFSVQGKGPKELSSIQLIVDDVTGNKSTKEFTVTVSFGELLSKDSKSFNINTRNGNTQGSGTLDLQYSGEKAVVKINGTSKEGPKLDIQMECHKIATMKSIMEEANK